MIDTVIKAAAAYNSLNVSLLDELLAEDFSYESQHVFDVMEGKHRFIEYLTGKFEAIKASGALVFAEIGFSEYENEVGKSLEELMENGHPCIIMAQGERENKGALLMFQFNNEGKVSRMDMCGISPSWRTAKRTHLYPGLE